VDPVLGPLLLRKSGGRGIAPGPLDRGPLKAQKHSGSSRTAATPHNALDARATRVGARQANLAGRRFEVPDR
jgi:hypothetical protein